MLNTYCWDKPARRFVERVTAQGGVPEQNVAEIRGNRHSCIVYITTPGDAWDGLLVRIYAVSDGLEAPVATGQIGDNTLQTLVNSADVIKERRGIICGVRNVACEAFIVRLANMGADDTGPGRFSIEAWGGFHNGR